MTTLTIMTTMGSLILFITMGSSLGSDDNTTATVWPSFGCHEYYNNKSDFLPSVNRACVNGSKYRDEVVKKKGFSIILDPKACIVQSVGIVDQMIKDSDSGGFIYNSKNGLKYMLGLMFGIDKAPAKFLPKDEDKKRDEYLADLVERGKTCNKRFEGERGTLPSDKYWGSFYKCIDRVWNCGQIAMSKFYKLRRRED